MYIDLGYRKSHGYLWSKLNLKIITRKIFVFAFVGIQCWLDNWKNNFLWIFVMGRPSWFLTFFLDLRFLVCRESGKSVSYRIWSSELYFGHFRKWRPFSRLIFLLELRGFRNVKYWELGHGIIILLTETRK